MRVMYFLIMLFCAAETWQNNHCNIRNRRMAYVPRVNSPNLTQAYSVLKSKVSDIPNTVSGFMGGRIVANPLKTTFKNKHVELLKSNPAVIATKPAEVVVQKDPIIHSNFTKRILKVNYDEAILMRAHLSGAEDLRFMKKLQRCNDIQVWAAGAYFMDFLVFREKRDLVEEKLKNRKENYTCLISHMKPLIHDQRYERSTAAPTKTLLRFDFKKYVSLESIDTLFDLLVRNYASYTELKIIGRSHENRDIMALRVNKNNSTKAMVVVGGIHGRDWVSVTSVLSVLGYLILEDNEQKAEFFDSLDWYFIPVLNPDGYQYSRFNDRFWSKNRNKRGRCVGVDLASNFEKHWDNNPIVEPTRNTCSDDYPGPEAFSEKETKALRDFIEDLQKLETVVGFIDVQAYGQTITFPWGGIKKMSPHWDTHNVYAQGMRQNIYSQTKEHYTFGPSYDIPHPRSGLSIDWAYSRGITHSYIIETRDTSQYGYLLPNIQVKPAGSDIVQALKSLAKRISEN